MRHGVSSDGVVDPEIYPPVAPASEMFRPGRSVEISWVARRVAKYRRTMVEDLTPDALVLLAPETHGAPELIAPGTALTVEVPRGSWAYMARVTVLDTRRVASEGGLPKALVTTTPPGEAVRAARPKFFRVDVSIPLTGDELNGTIVNLSACGCVVATDQKRLPDLGSFVSVPLVLPGQRNPMPLQGRVVRVSKGEGRAPAKVALEFQDIWEPCQDRIVRYTLQRQREFILKGVPGE